jgi:hypothetical protein
LLLPTLLNWFVEWTRKKFGMELKRRIKVVNVRMEEVGKEREQGRKEEEREKEVVEQGASVNVAVGQLNRRS